MFEVEVKAKSSGAVEANVRKLGKFIRKEAQTDHYFQHPCKDFRKTDEALRVRAVDDAFRLTYKGPKSKGSLKVRREIEFPIDERIFGLLESLGFFETLLVKKKREYYSVDGLEVSLDDVSGLGRYIEIESLDVKDEERILSLAEKLGIGMESFTTKTYSELLEEANNPRGP